jgi:acetyl-CoA carboxylase biotin carboxylase subunit
LAKLIVRGVDRQEVINIAKRALQEFTIQGIRNNIPLLLEIIDHPEFQKGNIHTSFLDQYIL